MSDSDAVARVALKVLTTAKDDGASMPDVVRALELVTKALRLELKEAHVERSASNVSLTKHLKDGDEAGVIAENRRL
jgi:hypothetical protein